MIADDYTLDKVLDKFKKINIEKLDDIRILIDTDDKWPNDITLKNVILMMCLMICIIKDGDKFCAQLFSKKRCMMNRHSAEHIKKI